MRSALEDLIAAAPEFELVAAVSDAARAVEMVREHKPDAVLLDVRMPRGGGAWAARMVRLISPATRVVALSAYNDRATVLDMLLAGASEYIVKGGSPGEILLALRRTGRGQLGLGGAEAQELLGDALDLVAVAEQAAAATQARFEDLLRSVWSAIGDLDAALEAHDSAAGVTAATDGASVPRDDAPSLSARARSALALAAATAVSSDQAVATRRPGQNEAGHTARTGDARSARTPA